MRKSGWFVLPAAFFLFLNFSLCSLKILFVERLIYFLFLVFLFVVLRRYSLGWLIKTVTGGVATIIFLYGIAQKFILFPHHLRQLTEGNDGYAQALVTRIKTGRIYSIFPLPTLYAIICVVLILFIFHYLVTTPAGHGKKKLAWALLLALGLFNLVLTQSFGGIVCLFAGGLVYLIVTGILKLKYLAPVMMVVALFLFVTVALRFSEARRLEPVKLRYSNWVQAGRMISASPFWGIGLGNYENKVSYYTLNSEAKSIYAHNFFLQFIAEVGIIFSAFLLLLFWNLRNKWKITLEQCRQNIHYVAVIVTLLVYNLVDIGIYFFSTGIIAVITLSQLFPYRYITHHPGQAREPRWKKAMLFIILAALSSLMLVESIADSSRVEGDIMQSQGNFSGAARCYRASFNLNPFNYRALLGYASIQIAQAQPSIAEKYLERALELDPDSALGNYLMSKIHFQNQRLFNALYHAAAASKKNPINQRYQDWYHYLASNLQQNLDPAWAIPKK